MTLPMPDITDMTRPYWDGLAEGNLPYQTCGACGHAWLPARERCPDCLSDLVVWTTASGEATIVSWVVYHTAYAPHLQDNIPYNVAIVALREGPRLLTNILDAPDGTGLSVGASVRLVIKKEGTLHLPCFKLSAALPDPAIKTRKPGS
jgi:uncharacterized protein